MYKKLGEISFEDGYDELEIKLENAFGNAAKVELMSDMKVIFDSCDYSYIGYVLQICT